MATLPTLPKIPTFPAVSNFPDPSIPLLANSTFTSGPSDTFAVADIYNLKSSLGGSKPITSIQELNAAVESNILGIQLNAGDASDFLSKMESGYLKFDTDLLTSRVLGTNNQFKTAFGELNDSMKKGSLLDTFKDKAKFISSTVGEVKSLVKAANIKDVKALGNFINRYTNSKIFSGQDKGAISGLLGSVITTSSNLGISGAFKAITDTINDNGILGRVTRAVLPIAMKNSDSKLLREITNSPAAGLINVLSPGFTQNFSKAFSYRGTNNRSLSTFEDVFRSFEKVNNLWRTVPRSSGGEATNVLAVVAGSRDFQNLVMSGVKYWVTEQNKPGGGGQVPPVPIDPLFALATSYSEITVGSAIKRDFPKVAMLNVYNERLPSVVTKTAGLRTTTNVNVIDPRIIQGSVGALLGL